MKNMSKTIQVYYIVAISLMILSIGGGLYYYWTSRLMDTNYTASIHEALSLIDSLKKENTLEDIVKQVDGDKIRIAVKEFEFIEKKILEVMDLVPKGNKQDIVLATEKMKLSLGKLLDYPDANSFLGVFSSKIEDLNRLTNAKGWKTLGRMSERLKVRLNNPKEFTSAKIENTKNTIIANLQLMKKTADSSTLSIEDKNRINSIIDTVQVESKIITNYSTDLLAFRSEIKSFKQQYQAWLGKIGPELTEEVLTMKRKSYFMVAIFIGLMLLSFTLLFLGGIIYRWHSLKTRKIFEKQFMDITRNAILSSQPKIPTDISDEFALELNRTQQYAQKRMNFSTLFQAALPFPALLLNANLKVVWANSSLCDLFHIALDECEKDSLSWDFLIRYTNLMDQDPVLEALMGNFSGIFQIRIKANDEQNGVPFEMYVCPINSGVSANVGTQKHVMLYFYPLSSMNETIQNQVKSLLNPIKKSLNALTDHTFDQKFRNQIRKDFVNAGIEDVFKGLEHLYDFTTREKNGLIEDITKLEANLSDNYKLLSDIEMQNNAFKKLQMELLDNLKLLREHLINYVDVSNSQHNSGDEMVSLYKNALLNADDMFRIATSNLEKIEETQEIISSLEKAKGSLRPIRENLQLLNNRIVQGLDKALTFERNFSGSAPELKQLSTNFVRLKTDIDLIDQQMKDFSNIIKYIDLKLSKASMILQNDEESMQLLRNYEKEGQAFEKKLEEGFYEKSKMIQEGQELEDKIVQSVEDFFVTFKKNLTHFTAINSLMKIYLQRDEEVEGTVLGSIKQIESQRPSNPIQ